MPRKKADIGEERVRGRKPCTRTTSEPLEDAFQELEKPLEVADLIERGSSPYLYWLSEVKWSLFGTLTWKDPKLRKASMDAELDRLKDFKFLMSQLPKKYKFRRKQLAYYASTETSPENLVHYHFLIAKKGIQWLKAAEVAEFIETFWTQAGLGTSQVTVIDSDELNRIKTNYCCKKDRYRKASDEKFEFLSDGLKKLIQNLSTNETA